MCAAWSTVADVFSHESVRTLSTTMCACAAQTGLWHQAQQEASQHHIPQKGQGWHPLLMCSQRSKGLCQADACFLCLCLFLYRCLVLLSVASSLFFCLCLCLTNLHPTSAGLSDISQVGHQLLQPLCGGLVASACSHAHRAHD